MANFIISYDLNGSRPTHAEMDKHLEKLGVTRGRILETVWYVGYNGTLSDLYRHIKTILSNNDLLFVVEGKEATWNELLLTTDSIKAAWNSNR